MVVTRENTPDVSSPMDPMLPEPWRVRHVRRETADTFTLTLSAEGARKNTTFTPGQFNMLYVFGVGEVPISISGAGPEPGTWMHTTRAVGTVTRAMEQLEVGDVIGVRGPFGRGWPIQETEGRDVVLVAGGLGLAPLRPILCALLEGPSRTGRLSLLYGTRTPGDVLFRSDLHRWSRRRDLQVHMTVDRAVGPWRANVGVVTSLIPHAPFDPGNTVAMVCGPEVMMRFTVLELQRRGVLPSRIHLSMERNMKCAVAICGHCQYGPAMVCRDGPVFRYDQVKSWLNLREL